MTTTTITKSYTEIQRDYYTIYSSIKFKDTLVFWEYYDIVRKTDVNKENLISLVKSYTPKSKASINVEYYGDRIEFLANSVFPVFYVVFK